MLYRVGFVISENMKLQSQILIFVVLALGHISPLAAQTDEIKLDTAPPKITTVCAMRVRKGPQTTAEEVLRLKLGTVVNAIARSTNQDTVSGKTDYWYRINLPNGETGWLFGGLLIDYDAQRRRELLRNIIGARLKAENTDFADGREIYDLAASSVNEAKDVSARAEFELLKLLALARWAEAFPDNLGDKSPYREWVKAHAAEVIHNEFGGAYNLRADLLWKLETKYRTLPIADRIAWEASQMLPPSDCEGDEVCHFFLYEGEIKYLNSHPTGAHAAEALKDLNDAVTDEIIKAANETGGDKYVIEQRTSLRQLLSSLRLALAKTTGPEKPELQKKLERITSRR
jgi:hypothetical protein